MDQAVEEAVFVAAAQNHFAEHARQQLCVDYEHPPVARVERAAVRLAVVALLLQREVHDNLALPVGAQKCAYYLLAGPQLCGLKKRKWLEEGCKRCRSAYTHTTHLQDKLWRAAAGRFSR